MNLRVEKIVLTSASLALLRTRPSFEPEETNRSLVVFLTLLRRLYRLSPWSSNQTQPTHHKGRPSERLNPRCSYSGLHPPWTWLRPIYKVQIKAAINEHWSRDRGRSNSDGPLPACSGCNVGLFYSVVRKWEFSLASQTMILMRQHNFVLTFHFRRST